MPRKERHILQLIIGKPKCLPKIEDAIRLPTNRQVFGHFKQLTQS